MAKQKDSGILGPKVSGVYNATPPTLQDGETTDLQLDSAGNHKVNVAAGTVTAIVSGTPTAVSQSGAGAVTAPTAGATIATLTPGAGTYRVVVTVGFGGSGTPTAAADYANFQLKNGAAGVGTVTAQPSAPSQQVFEKVVVGAGALTVVAVGAATAAVAYIATIVATPEN